MDHFPLISSSQCYARSDQEDFSLPLVCSGLAYALRSTGRSQRKWLSSLCRRRSGTKSWQQRHQGPSAQFHPRATASNFPLSDQFLQMTRAALPHHHPTTTPSETPRSAAHRVQAMLPLPRLSRLGKHPAPRWEWDPPPRGARSSPTTSAISSTYFRLAARSKHGFPGAPPTSGNHLPK